MAKSANIPEWLMQQLNGNASSALAVMRGWKEIIQEESLMLSQLEAFEIAYRE